MSDKIEPKLCNNCKKEMDFQRLDEMGAWECCECGYPGYFDDISVLVEYWNGGRKDACYDWYEQMADVPGLTHDQQNDVLIRQLRYERVQWQQRAQKAEAQLERYKNTISVMQEIFNHKEEF